MKHNSDEINALEKAVLGLVTVLDTPRVMLTSRMSLPGEQYEPPVEKSAYSFKERVKNATEDYKFLLSQLQEGSVPENLLCSLREFYGIKTPMILYLVSRRGQTTNSIN